MFLLCAKCLRIQETFPFPGKPLGRIGHGLCFISDNDFISVSCAVLNHNFLVTLFFTVCSFVHLQRSVYVQCTCDLLSDNFLVILCRRFCSTIPNIQQ